jgi:hypothetical protein
MIKNIDINLLKKIFLIRLILSMEKIKKQTFTLTYGNCAENHRSMEIIGSRLDEGLSKADLDQAKLYFKNLGATCELIHLNTQIKDLVPKEEYEKIKDAYLLVVRNGTEYILGTGKTNELYMEQEALKKDTKAFMYGRVVNKKARHNLCFSDFDQEADFENKKGTVVNFNRVQLTKKIRETIPKIITNQIVNKLQCEGNYYYDVKTTYIGFHGDTEREIVIAVRLGCDFPLYYQWFNKGKKVGPLFETILSHGDIYFMSDKAVGHDWKRPSIYSLRHAAGLKSYVGLDTSLDTSNEPVKKDTKDELKKEVIVKSSKKEVIVNVSKKETNKDKTLEPKKKKSAKKVKEIEV